MKKTIFLFCLLAFAQWGFAQKEAAIWYFGENTGLDFNSGTPVFLTDGALKTTEGCATISDFNGNLLFYTDGITVWNRNHLPMPNGTGLLGDPSSTQSGIIVPQPGTTNLYYIFTVDNEAQPYGLNYSIVDMSPDGGLGDITNDKNILLRTPISEKLTAVTHANGNSIWVIAKAYGSNEFLSYLIDNTGLNTSPVTSPIGMTPSVTYDAIGYMKVSPDGRFLATATADHGEVELFRFDTATGIVSDGIFLLDFFFDGSTNDRRTYGVEFSPNNQILYICAHSGIFQFDISTYDEATILASGTNISPDYGGAILAGALQMGIDGKIYASLIYQDYLMVINNPNVLGPGCNFVEDGVYLGGRRSLLGLPPFIVSYFYVGIQINSFCVGHATKFAINTGETISSISWDFGDGNTSTDQNPSHIYAASGDYRVEVTISNATETKTETKEITIYDNPVANPVSDWEICSENPTYPFDLSTKDSEVLVGHLATDFAVSYHSNQLDADNNTNLLPIPYTNFTASERVYVRIANKYNPACFETTSFDLLVKEAPVLNSVEYWSVCDTDYNGQYSFDLSQKDNEILGGQDAANFTISYFETQGDADAGTNAIGPTYTNSASPQEIFFRIENTQYPECYQTGSFSLEVINGVTANIPSDYEVCDTDNDRIQTFDLLSKNVEIIGSQNPGSISVSYHSSQEDADAGMNAVSTDYTNINPYSEILFIRVENTSNPDCYDTTTLNLAVYDVPVPQEESNWQVCDSDYDGVATFLLSEKDPEILGDQSATEFSVSYHLTETDAQTGQNASQELLKIRPTPSNYFTG